MGWRSPAATIKYRDAEFSDYRTSVTFVPGRPGTNGAMPVSGSTGEAEWSSDRTIGGPASPRFDPLGKGMAQMLLDLPVAVPASLAAQLQK